MAEVLSRDAESKSQTGEKEMWQERLDGLLEQYLNLLDEYEKHRKILSENMSAGFMSLAQANFTSQSRTRYGQDYYDERMRALRRVDVKSQEGRMEFSIQHCDIPATDREDEEAEEHDSIRREIPAANAAKDLHSAEGSTGDFTEEESSSVPQTISRDPIRWFGLLVPRDLHTSQDYFIGVVEDVVGQITTVKIEMDRLAIDIRRARKQIVKLK